MSEMINGKQIYFVNISMKQFPFIIFYFHIALLIPVVHSKFNSEM